MTPTTALRARLVGALRDVGPSREEDLSRSARRAAWLWWVGSGSGLLWAVTAPHAAHRLLVVAIAIISAGVGAFAALGKWGAKPSITVTQPGLGLCVLLVAQWASGGSASPARFLIFMVIAYVAYYYSPGVAAIFVVAGSLTHACPLVYDPSARSGTFAAELLLIAPVHAVIAAMISSSKREMTVALNRAHDAARTDPLTALRNSRAMWEALHRALDEPTAAGGLVLFDVDDFRSINTRYGHPGGDEALVRIADALLSTFRRTDTVARMGGDEFAVLVEGASRADVAELAQRALDAIATLMIPLGADLVALTATAGWVEYRAADQRRPAADLIAAADSALYQAKAAGKGRALRSSPTSRWGLSTNHPVRLPN